MLAAASIDKRSGKVASSPQTSDLFTQPTTTQVTSLESVYYTKPLSAYSYTGHGMQEVKLPVSSKAGVGSLLKPKVKLKALYIKMTEH